MLVGFKVSPLLWSRFTFSKEGGSLSAGRCQTPALNLVYENDKDLKRAENNGKEEQQKIKITGLFGSKRVKFELNET